MVIPTISVCINQKLTPFVCIQRACINRSLLQAIEREPDPSRTGKKSKKDPSQRKRRQSSKSESRDSESKDVETKKGAEKQATDVDNKENPPLAS